jgi:hypothetical protein
MAPMKPLRLLTALALAVALNAAIAVTFAADFYPSGSEGQHGTSWVNGRVYQGEAVDVDLPESQQIVNIGSHKDGAGLCVTSAAEMSFRWAGVESMRGLRDWCANEPGGADPAKLDDQIARFCAEKKQPIPPYVQYEGADPLPILQAALKSGRAVAGTYGWSPRYKDRNGQILPYIAHMVLYVHAGNGQFVAVLDDNFCGPPNPKGNFPGGSQAIEWMSAETAVHRCKWPMRTGWLFIPLAPPPPPSPRN